MAYPNMKEDCRDLKSSYNCFKLLGFDIIIDDNLRPWVLEVNTDPCLFAGIFQFNHRITRYMTVLTNQNTTSNVS